MNRKKTTKMLVAIILMLSFSSLGSIKAISAEPKSSADGALNFWFASKGFEKDYCNDFMIAKVSVNSPTDSIPTEVKAEINGVNHTMTAPLYDISGSLNAKNFSDGIKYYYVIDTPTVGDYNLTIHAGNSSGYVASSKLEEYYNKTLALDTLWSNGTGEVNQLDQYEYLFQLSTSLDDYECIEEVVVNINETSYTMNESDFYSPNVYRDFLF